MTEQVNYHLLRPHQIVARRKQCPIAYLPIGTIEWHGPHNPLGADSLQAEALAQICAQKGGGLAFPPLYYGENRLQALVETSSNREKIAQQMELPPENFTAEPMPFSAMEQTLNYNKLLLHILAEIESLGFEVCVILPGHYPLIDHACAAVLQFNQRLRSRGGKGLLAWAAMECRLKQIEKEYKFAGDHGGIWETSHLLATHPETVDMSKLPPKGQETIGVASKLPPQDATAELGRETFEKAADIIIAEAQRRIDNRPYYLRNGRSLHEGPV